MKALLAFVAGCVLGHLFGETCLQWFWLTTGYRL